MMRFVVTGANGFVGRVLCNKLVSDAHHVTGLVRPAGSCVTGIHEWAFAGDDFEGVASAWPSQLRCDCVVHLAARVHLMQDDAIDPLAAYRRTNVDGSLRVAEAAVRAGVKRFVFVSSVKALGEIEPGRPWRENDTSAPSDPYGISKRDAEDALFAFGRDSGLEVVAVRPPLVYGPGVRANFLQLMHAIWRGWPLPLAAIDARRSMVFVDNLADALLHCATHPHAPGKVFHVADGGDLTVAELARTLGRQLNRPARLWPVPVGLLHALGRVTGRGEQINRLVAPLRLDITRIQTELGWRPPHSVDHGLLETANWYRSVY